MQTHLVTNSFNVYPATETQMFEWEHYLNRVKRRNASTTILLNYENVLGITETFNLLTKRHESLRTTFLEINGLVNQIIHDEIHFHIELKDFSKLSDKETLLNSYYDEFCQFQFNIEIGPLFKVVLAKVDEEKYLLMFAIDHVVSDMDSMLILKADFLYICQSIISSSKIELGDLNFQMKDYALWEREFHNSELGNKNLLYWQKELLENLAPFELKKTYPEITINEPHTSFTVFIENDLLSKIEQIYFSKSIFFMAIYILWLSLVSKRKDILISLPLSNRENTDLMGVVGYLISDIVLRVDTSNNVSVKDFLQVVFEKYTLALSNRHYPHRKLGRSMFPFCAAKLNNVTSKKNEFDYDGPTGLNPIDGKLPYFPLDCVMLSFKNGWLFHFNYNPSIWGNRVPGIFPAFQDLLNSIIANPNSKINDISVNIF